MAGRITGAVAAATSASYYVMTYTTTGSSRNDIEMDQIQEMLLSGHLWVIVLIPQPHFYVGWAVALEIFSSLTSPVVLFKQVQYMEWPTDSHFHPTLDLNYATGALFLYLDPSLRLFNTDKCWQGPYICALQPYQLGKATAFISSRNAVYSSCHYLNHYIELSNLSRKLASLTSLPLSQTVEIHHYTKESMRMFKQFDSSAHTQPLSYLPSVCPYSTVSTGHHSKIFVSTYSKTLIHGGRVLAMILATKSFLGTSKFHYFTQQYPPNTLPSCLLLPHVAAWAASHREPFSIYDGALAIPVEPSFTLQKIR